MSRILIVTAKPQEREISSKRFACDYMQLLHGSVPLNVHVQDPHCYSKTARVRNLFKTQSPFPGFSLLQQNRKSEKSLQNASHVTTCYSFIDIYRPKWAVLKNVANMATLRTSRKRVSRDHINRSDMKGLWERSHLVS